MLSQIDSPEFRIQLSADQQSTIHEILAAFRKSSLRCHEEIKKFLQNEQLYLGSHEMIGENLNAPNQRATFQTWLQHLEPFIAQELNALFLNERQIQDKLMQNYHEQQLAFHHYFWKTSQEYTHDSSRKYSHSHLENFISKKLYSSQDYCPIPFKNR